MKFKYIKSIIISLVVIIIPFFYVLFFLKAFFDPYNNLKNVPVAIVNLDDGKLGNEIINKIKNKEIMNTIILENDEEAKSGVKNRKYYASITIPENFSTDINNLNKTEIIFRSNKKLNFIASQIYEKAASEIQHIIKENVANEIVKNLNSNIINSSGKISTLNDGFSLLSDGANSLYMGTNELNSKYKEFDRGVNKLNSAISQIDDGATLYIKNVDKTLNGLDLISDGVVKLGDKLKVLKLNKDFTKLYDGAKMIKDEKVTEKLNQGGAKLKKSLKDLKVGSNKINSSSSLIREGISKINTGANKLDNGINTAKNKVDGSVNETKEKIKKIDNLDDFVENSISLKVINIDDIENYGTGFASYFISISLWVGAVVIMIVMYYDTKSRFYIFDRKYNTSFKQHLAYLGFILAQSVILSLLIAATFNFAKLNFIVFFVSILITDLAFFSMVYFFISLFDDIGKFLSVMLLIIQISASAGTFPIETSPRFFLEIFPFVPMKYAVNLFKEALAGFDKNFFIPNFTVLLGIFIGFTVITIIVNYFKKKLVNK